MNLNEILTRRQPDLLYHALTLRMGNEYAFTNALGGAVGVFIRMHAIEAPLGGDAFCNHHTGSRQGDKQRETGS